MKEKILNPQWIYDIVLNEARQRVEKDESFGNLLGSFNVGSVELSKSDLQMYERIHKNVFEIMKKTRPIAVGPATLESLLNQKPESYQALVEGKLPFDNMFFEFVAPVQIGLPFVLDEINLRGIRFHKSNLPKSGGLSSMLYSAFNNQFPYEATLYYQDNSMKLHEFTTFFNPSKINAFYGFSKDFGKFHADLLLEKVFYTTKDEMINNHLPWYKKLTHGGHNNSAKLEDVENYSTFTSVGNLITNIINYINAQNTTLVEGSRNVDVMLRDEDNKKKKITRKMPFYIVNVESKTAYEEPVPTGKTWELNRRIYVRGHNRHYRNDDGKIREVIWIAPYIKGPEGAPWRDQRHAIMGNKVKQERDFISNFA